MMTFMPGNLALPRSGCKGLLSPSLTDQGLRAREPRLSRASREGNRGFEVIAGSISRRYARALFTLALEEDGHEQIGEELETVARTIRSSAEARTLVESPAYTPAQRHALVDLLVEKLSLSPSVGSFLRLLADRHRLAEIGAIARSYGEMLDEKVGRVRATVISARPLAEDELRHVRDALAAATRRTVVLDSRSDPRIVGGVITQVGPKVWDGSIRTQLERLRRELKTGPF
jgi:F-type H+-transporting ATPase subunit delta